MPEAREAGADVVDGDAHAPGAQRRERLDERVVVVHGHVLGDLDDDPVRDRLEQLGELRREQGRRRDVDREVGSARQVAEPVQRRRDRRQLELHAEPEPCRLGEPGRRRALRLGAEPCERLERDDRVALEVEDGLEHHLDPAALERVSNPRLAQADWSSRRGLTVQRP